YAERIKCDIPNTATIKPFLSKAGKRVSSDQIAPRPNMSGQKSATISFTTQGLDIAYSSAKAHGKRQAYDLPTNVSPYDSDLSQNYLRSINISGSFIRKRLSPDIAKRC